MDFGDDRGGKMPKPGPAGPKLELAGHSPWDSTEGTEGQQKKRRILVDLPPPSAGLDPSLVDAPSEVLPPPPPPPGGESCERKLGNGEGILEDGWRDQECGSTMSQGRIPLVLSGYLDINTGHMTGNDCKILEFATENTIAGLIVYKYREGFWFHVSTDESLAEEQDLNIKKAGLSLAFQKVIKAARAKGAEFVRFDRDGNSYGQFDQFSW